MATYVNEAKAKKVDDRYAGGYGFEPVPKLLFSWARLFQMLISQVGTHMLTGKFHNQDCGIYKVEGGCRIDGVGELVPCSRDCYFDTYHGTRYEGEKDKDTRSMAKLITKIVLGWDPEDPVESMLESAGHMIEKTGQQVREEIIDPKVGGVFGGNALSSFFDWNPFSEPPVDRKYQRFCMVDIEGQDPADVDEKFRIEDLGKSYKERINNKIKEADNNTWTYAMCCSPSVFDDGTLNFWINTGTRTQIDGWKSEDDIKAFLKSDGVLVEPPRKVVLV